MKALASAEGHLSASGGCNTLLAIARPASPRITWFGLLPLGRPVNALNTSECALRFLGFRMDANGSAGTSVAMPSKTLELVKLMGPEGPWGLLTDGGVSG